jgi:two-component system, NtrC family, response regulator HydG
MASRLLLVDDNDAFLDSTKDVLEDAGYLVVTASNGEEALSLSREQAFDVILMDIKMPGMNGVETFLKMKEHDPAVKVILVTAYSAEKLSQKALEEGVCDIMSKPLRVQMLLKRIEELRGGKEGVCILVADDDRGLCDNLRDTLEQEGYRVATALAGPETVRKAEKESFDILLLDMNLPGMSGLQVYREVKRSQPNLITILITGFAEEFSDQIDQAIQENAYTCVRKPIDMKRLLDLLKTASERRSSAGYPKPEVK